MRRIAPWITLAVSAVIVFMLARALRKYDFAEVLRNVQSVDAARLALAIAFAAGSYATLTLFDTLAVRYVRHALPYRRTALASFTALSIGHTVGLAALSSGAVRYRFYARWGLSAEEIGKVILFCGLTVGLGLLTLAGLAWTFRPDVASDLTGLPLWIARLIGIGCLFLSAGWLALAALSRRPFRIRRWRLQMPRLPLAAAQIVIGTVNFGLVAAALYHCVRSAAEARYVEVAAAYVIGNSAAIASHVPGGLGVIEGVVMYLLPQADLLGAVLLFRAVYYLLPLPFGLLSLLAAELFHRTQQGRAARREPARVDAAALPAQR
jgi:hypothetical protein